MIRPELAHHQRVPLDRLTPHPENPNDGDVEAVAESLTYHGQYRAITAWARDDGSLMVLAGHTTWYAAASLGWSELAAELLRGLTEADALRILLTDNATARRARMNGAHELALLGRLYDTTDGLAGTGWDDELYAGALAAADALSGLPLPEPDDAPAPRQQGVRDMLLTLTAADHAELTALHARMRQVIGEQGNAVCALVAARCAVAVLDGGSGHRPGCDCTWCSVARVAALGP